MSQAFWPVLIVDDEPDVLRASELAMQNFTVYGLPIKLYTADSKAAAVELLKNKLTRQWAAFPYLAVAFIDVVMESDKAGLELCEYIRETTDNKLTQLFIRTGQPGVASERDVIDRYDINGYFTKVEATEDKLYSLVKSGVRQFFTLDFSIGIHTAIEMIVSLSDSREQLEQFLSQMMASGGQDADGEDIGGYIPAAYFFLKEKNYGVGMDEADAQALMNRLDQLPGTPIGANGDKYVIADDHNLFIQVASGPTQAEMYYIAQWQMPVPEFGVKLAHSFVATFAKLWHNAA